jgi:DNA-binding beta-propeller fold protein YncE
MTLESSRLKNSAIQSSNHAENKALKTMSTKRQSSFSQVGRSMVAALSGFCSLAVLSSAQANPPHNTVVATVNVGSSPVNPACSPDGKSVYVQTASQIVVIDTATNQLSTSFSVAGTGSIALSQDSQTLYATADGGVEVISVASHSVIKTIPVPSAGLMVVTPNAGQLWVCSEDVGNGVGGIYVILTATNEINGGPITIGQTVPLDLVFTPNSGEAFAIFNFTLGIDGELAEIDTSTQTVVNPHIAERALHGSGKGPPRVPFYVSMDPNGKKVYVFDVGVRSRVYAVTLSNEKAEQISSAAPGAASCQSITPDGRYLYFLTSGASISTPGKVTSISTETGEIVGRQPNVGDNPIGMAIAPSGTRAYVANRADGTVSVIDIQ